MITPIKSIKISDLLKRENDLLVSVDDIKAIAKNEREKVIKQLLADLSPCVICFDSKDCDKDYFFKKCANEKSISWDELRLRAEQLKGQKNEV